MTQPLRIGIIGDFDPGNISHTATVDALSHAANSQTIDLKTEWLPTGTLDGNVIDSNLKRFDGFWGASGSPYKSMNGALRTIQFCRENGWPFLGT